MNGDRVKEKKESKRERERDGETKEEILRKYIVNT